MNLTTGLRVAATSAAISVLLAVSACGTQKVSETDPGNQPAAQSRPYPPLDVPVWTPNAKPGAQSADGAEHRADALKERQERASQQRWERGSHQETRMQGSGHPGQP